MPVCSLICSCSVCRAVSSSWTCSPLFLVRAPMAIVAREVLPACFFGDSDVVSDKSWSPSFRLVHALGFRPLCGRTPASSPSEPTVIASSASIAGIRHAPSRVGPLVSRRVTPHFDRSNPPSSHELLEQTTKSLLYTHSAVQYSLLLQSSKNPLDITEPSEFAFPSFEH